MNQGADGAARQAQREVTPPEKGSAAESAAPGFPRVESEPACFPSPAQAFALIGVYFALQIVIRTLLSPSADLDESEQFVLGQTFSWGYSSDPPLYNWIQKAFFEVFGQTIFALSLFKNLLLFSLYALTFWNARFITHSRACGVAAAFALLFLPEIAWESQRDLTHSILASVLAAGTLGSFLKLHQSRTTPAYLLLGLCVGLGLLTKYNYAFWAIGLVLAAVAVPEFRFAILNPRIFLSLAACVLVFLPNGLWILSHRELAFLTSSKLDVQNTGSYIGTVGLGMRNLLVSMAAFLGPVAALSGVLLWKRPQPAITRPGAEHGRLLLWAVAMVAAVLTLTVLGFRATGFRERWFQPILVCAPVLAITLGRNHLDKARLKWFTALASVVMLAMAIVMPARIVYAERLKREEPLNRPYDELAAQLRAAIPHPGFIVAEDTLLGGNLRQTWSGTLILTPELASLYPNRGPRGVIVWDATRKDAPPARLLQWAQSVAPRSLDVSSARYFTATYKFHQSRQRRLGVLMIE